MRVALFVSLSLAVGAEAVEEEKSSIRGVRKLWDCPYGDGYYCGNSNGVPSGLDPDKLYECDDGHYDAVKDCGDGMCILDYPGFDDYCQEDAADRCPHGFDVGYYCGDYPGIPTSENLDADTLYRCVHGDYTVEEDCAANSPSEICYQEPPGEHDTCKPAPPAPTPSPVPGPSCTPFEDNFDPIVDSNWAKLDGAHASSVCGAESGSKALVFKYDDEDDREAKSRGLRLDEDSVMTFFVKAGRDDGTSGACDDPEGGDEDLFLWFTDCHNKWYLVRRFESDSSDYDDFTKVTLDATDFDRSINCNDDVVFDFYQPDNSGDDKDFWAIDDVKIECDGPSVCDEEAVFNPDNIDGLDAAFIEISADEFFVVYEAPLDSPFTLDLPDGCFCEVEVLSIGAGAGGGYDLGGGGGAGAVNTGSIDLTSVSQDVTVNMTIGSGGEGGIEISSQGEDGKPTTVTVSAGPQALLEVEAGGGGGGGGGFVSDGRDGLNGTAPNGGGSGGGGGAFQGAGSGGFPGGNDGGGGVGNGGGGGGAGGEGQDAVGPPPGVDGNLAGPGGNGTFVPSNFAQFFPGEKLAAGGGGGGGNGVDVGAEGGDGGGGDGGSNNEGCTPGSTPGSGGGGGGTRLTSTFSKDGCDGADGGAVLRVTRCRGVVSSQGPRSWG